MVNPEPDFAVQGSYGKVPGFLFLVTYGQDKRYFA